MDKIVQQLATAFGVAVAFWSLGVAIMAPVFVKCITAGWQNFVLDEYQTAALAAVVAGPVALTLRLFGFKPACPNPDQTPASPASDQSQEQLNA